ncbi:MAG: TldD/PmbA family protein [Erysipelotrichaceae bacterium]|nr:TldD/PmbA family protein [Erysipelotrichaceae bacterium]
MSKYDIFFKLAKEAGIENCELTVSESYSFGFAIFHAQVEQYEVNNGFAIAARGIINGKAGSASCDVFNKEKAKYLVDEIVKNAKVMEDDDPVFIYPGSPKYKKVNTVNKELRDIPEDKKIKDALELERLVRAKDQRIVEVANIYYQEDHSSFTIMNSLGLKLSQKNNNFFMYAAAVAKQGDEVKSNGAFFLDNDYSKLDLNKLADEAVNNTVSQLGGEACESNNYKVVLDRDAFSSLINAYISSTDAEEVQKKTSLFIGKLGQKIASKKVTIEDAPLAKSLFARSFDNEGVATYNKPIIKNGILQTYLYNLTTAAKDGVESTGNGFGSAAKSGVSPVFLRMKPGKLSLNELFAKVNNGVYITEINGLHAGLDPQTGNFSLQSAGFLIKDGKKDRPLDVITISGNLIKLFEGIEEVGNDSKVFAQAVENPSVIVNKLAVGGK